MLEVFERSQSYIFILYAALLLYINISYLLEYRKIQKGLLEIESEQEVDFKTESFTVVLFVLAFAFFRSWLYYIIVYYFTAKVLVIFLLMVYLVMDSYDALFNTSLERMRRSKIKVTRVLLDTLFITIFTVYYLVAFM